VKSTCQSNAGLVPARDWAAQTVGEHP
jgi:hypothetical protein